MVTQHGVIAQQSTEVQSLCTQFTQSYNKHRKTVADWGCILQAIRDSKLNTVSSEGKPLEVVDTKGNSVDVQGKTFTTICQEQLGVPRSTAYHYINMYVVTLTYPTWLQDAATAKNLNLAAQHVQNKFQEVRNRENYPVNPDEFQIGGIVAELKAAKASTPESEPLTAEELKSQIQRLLKRAKNAKIASEIVYATLEEAIAASFGATGAIVTREMAPIYKLDR